MTHFRTEITRRIATTRADLEQAHLVGDDYLVRIRLGELEGLAHLATEHGIEIEGVAESLARFGVSTPAPGVPLGVDLREQPLPRDPRPPQG